jgi:hypothetical protein
MSIARLSRDRKRQLGQFLTPLAVSEAIVSSIAIAPHHRVLEPSFGEGAFVFPIIESLRTQLSQHELQKWCSSHLYGCEVDHKAYGRFSQLWQDSHLGPLPHTLRNCDFFQWMPPGCDARLALSRRHYFHSPLAFFDLVIGNPPFGGSIDPTIQDEADAIWGFRDGMKIKKETYAFFIVKGVDLLKPGGRLIFICSDTLLTIATMTGLRKWLQNTCSVAVHPVPGFFSDTNQDMVLLSLTKEESASRSVRVFGAELAVRDIEATPNMSWRISGQFTKYFSGNTLGDKMVATSGMTVGNNKLFLRRIEQGIILEPYEFSLIQQRITLANELARARLGKLSDRRKRELTAMEQQGVTETALIWQDLGKPRKVHLPSRDYCYYNKSTSRILYSEPEWMIYWRDDGKYVYTYKKTGNWYLRGVGGMKYFKREGLTWALIAPRLRTRYLPPGYILDSGAPCAFLRHGIPHDELYFILGWTLTDLCNDILKNVINHTRNIQSKDFERLPYPVWVCNSAKQQAVALVKRLVARSQHGENIDYKDAELQAMSRLYAWHDFVSVTVSGSQAVAKQMVLFSDGKQCYKGQHKKQHTRSP